MTDSERPGDWGMGGGDRDQAKIDQDFREPFDRSPFKNPSGWYGGRVRQTGGMVMCREWSTLPDNELYLVHDSCPGREYEYEIAYNEEPRVAVIQYKWNPDDGAYIHNNVIDKRTPEENTDQQKAGLAKTLMSRHADKTQ